MSHRHTRELRSTAPSMTVSEPSSVSEAGAATSCPMNAAGGTRGFPFNQEPSRRSVGSGLRPAPRPSDVSHRCLQQPRPASAPGVLTLMGAQGSRSGNTWALSLLQLKDLESPQKLALEVNSCFSNGPCPVHCRLMGPFVTLNDVFCRCQGWPQIPVSEAGGGARSARLPHPVASESSSACVCCW